MHLKRWFKCYRCANLLAGAANASATDVYELKYGLSASAQSCRRAGMTFKDTSTALAVFAQNGLTDSPVVKKFAA